MQIKNVPGVLNETSILWCRRRNAPSFRDWWPRIEDIIRESAHRKLRPRLNAHTRRMTSCDCDVIGEKAQVAPKLDAPGVCPTSTAVPSAGPYKIQRDAEHLERLAFDDCICARNQSARRSRTGGKSVGIGKKVIASKSGASLPVWKHMARRTSSAQISYFVKVRARNRI